MRHFHYKKNPYACSIVNLDKLWTLVSDQTREQYKDKKDVAPVIDVVKAVCSPLVRSPFVCSLICSFSICLI